MATKMQTNPWSNKKILIVDDSNFIRKDLAQKYESIGLVVCGEAANGLDALKLVTTLDPDLVSLDIIMPEMHGMEVYIKLKIDYPKIKSFIVSSLVREQKFLESIKEKYGTSHLFCKPLGIDLLTAWLAKESFEDQPKIKNAG